MQRLASQQSDSIGIEVSVIATRCRGIPEPIDDGFLCFLVPERDMDAIANKIEYLIQNSDPEVWQLIG